MSWVGGGFSLAMLHIVEDDARSDVLAGETFWWSRCDSMCVAIPEGTDVSRYPLCAACFPHADREQLQHQPPPTAAEPPADGPDETVGWFDAHPRGKVSSAH